MLPNVATNAFRFSSSASYGTNGRSALFSCSFFKCFLTSLRISVKMPEFCRMARLNSPFEGNFRRNSAVKLTHWSCSSSRANSMIPSSSVRNYDKKNKRQIGKKGKTHHTIGKETNTRIQYVRRPLIDWLFDSYRKRWSNQSINLSLSQNVILRTGNPFAMVPLTVSKFLRTICRKDRSSLIFTEEGRSKKQPRISFSKSLVKCGAMLPSTHVFSEEPRRLFSHCGTSAMCNAIFPYRSLFTEAK